MKSLLSLHDIINSPEVKQWLYGWSSSSFKHSDCALSMNVERSIMPVTIRWLSIRRNLQITLDTSILSIPTILSIMLLYLVIKRCKWIVSFIYIIYIHLFFQCLVISTLNFINFCFISKEDEGGHRRDSISCGSFLTLINIYLERTSEILYVKNRRIYLKKHCPIIFSRKFIEKRSYPLTRAAPCSCEIHHHQLGPSRC